MKNYQILCLILFVSILILFMGTWLGTYKKEIYNHGYNHGFKDCQRGYLPEPYERHIEKNPRLKPKS